LDLGLLIALLLIKAIKDVDLAEGTGFIDGSVITIDQEVVISIIIELVHVVSAFIYEEIAQPLFELNSSEIVIKVLNFVKSPLES